jgi:hypothetical protein
MTTTPEQDMSDAETELLAKQLGWKPKEEFAGDPERWSDAKTFVATGMNQLPILRENVKKISSRLEDMSNKYGQQSTELQGVRTQLQEVTPVLTELRDRAVEADKRGYERAMTEITTRQREAVDTADRPAYEQAERDRVALEAKKPVEPAKSTTTGTGNGGASHLPNPDLQYVDQWMKSEERAWYRNDPELQAAAEAAHAGLRRSKPALTIQENLAQAEATVRKLYADKFGDVTTTTRREPVSQVESPRGAPAKKDSDRIFANVPAEDKKAFYRMKTAIDKTSPNKPFTEAEFLETYQWDS